MHLNHFLPLFYKQPEIVWVDDDKLLLDVITDNIQQKLTCNKFYNPEEALKYLLDYMPTLARIKLTKPRTDLEDYDLLEHMPIDINPDALNEIRTSILDVQEISLIIVDFRMPSMTGVELLKKVQHLPAKKILLTGEVDETLAISAFNEGLIDCFIKKDDPNLMATIENYISELHHQYYVDLSLPLLKHLESEKPLPFSDIKFAKFFKSWMQENNISAYTLLDKFGALQVFDDQNKSSFFVIHSDHTLNQFLDLQCDQTCVETLINPVKQRQKIPYFGIGRESWQLPMEQWEHYFYPAQTFIGRENYYWTNVSG